MKLIKRHPFLTYGLIVLFVHVIVLASGAQYDHDGLGGVLILSSPIWAVIYWAPSEIIYILNNGVAIKGHEIFSVISGLFLCLFADYLLKLYRDRKSEELVDT